MTNKMTHDEFIAYCAEIGKINISKITRKYIHLEDEVIEPPINILPNNSPSPHLEDSVISADWTDGFDSISLSDYIKEGRKIMCIKIIRSNTDHGLKDSKDIVDANWNAWRGLLGVVDSQ